MKRKYGYKIAGDTKSGFTLAEVLITLVTLGIVIALTVPSILSKKPNENMVKFKKAYATVEKVVTEMANNEEMYPNDGNPPTRPNVGGTDTESNFCATSIAITTANRGGTTYTCHRPVFMNTINRTVDGTIYGSALNAAGTAPASTDNAQRKFCALFASMVNTVGPVFPGASVLPTINPGEITTGSFSTSDGIVWAISTNPITSVRADGNTNEPNGAIQIQVDVNNGNRSTNTSGGNNPDRFRFWVDYDGKITVPSEDLVAIQYLRQTSPSFKCRNGIAGCP